MIFISKTMCTQTGSSYIRTKNIFENTNTSRCFFSEIIGQLQKCTLRLVATQLFSFSKEGRVIGSILKRSWLDTIRIFQHFCEQNTSL